MKKRYLKKILGLFDQEEHGSFDYSQFDEPERVKNQVNELIMFRDLLAAREKSFSPFFTDRVMGKLNQLVTSPSFEEYLSMQFSKVMAFGLTAVVILFLSLYFMQGIDGINSFLGTDSSNDINFVSSLFYDF